MNFLKTKKGDCCCICLDISPDIANLCCGSASHFRCMRKWAESACDPEQTEAACPMCRHPFTSKIATMTPLEPIPTPNLQSSPSPMLSNDRFVPTLRSPPAIRHPVDISNETLLSQNLLSNQANEGLGIFSKTPKVLMVLLLVLYLTFVSAVVFTYLRECRLHSSIESNGSPIDKPRITQNILIEAVLYTLSAAMIIEMTKAVITSSRDL
jgi:cell division protein FtsL